MAKITDLPCAEWLEEALHFIAEEVPEKIVIACRCEDGAVATKYFGCDVEDQAVFGHYITTDALMGTVLANADKLKKRFDELEENDETED